MSYRSIINTPGGSTKLRRWILENRQYRLYIVKTDDGYAILPDEGWALPGAYRESYSDYAYTLIRLHVLSHTLQSSLNAVVPPRPERLPAIYRLEPYIYVSDWVTTKVFNESDQRDEEFLARWGVIKDPTRTAGGKIHYMVVLEIEGYRQPLQEDILSLKTSVMMVNALYEMNANIDPNSWGFDDDSLLPG
ncbi:MAG: hypothetical protein ACUVS2_04970 [Candidatus Flexifilum sp.]|jgi:hypothetical protein